MADENASPAPAPKKKGLWARLNFPDRKTFAGFMSIVFAGQLFYTCLQSMRAPFYTMMLKMLHVNNTQLGLIFTICSISTFLTIPGGWVINRYSVKSILITCLSIRCVTIAIMIYGNLNTVGLFILSGIWGLIQSVFFPSVLNGVALLTNKKNKSTGFAILESARRALGLILDWIMIGMLALAGTYGTMRLTQMGLFRFTLLIFDLLLIPLIWIIFKNVPTNGIAAGKEKKKNTDALKGLGKALLMPKLWIAALTAMTIYWVQQLHTYNVPYLQKVFHVSQGSASFFGTISGQAMGIIASLLGGFLADKWLHSTSKLIMLSLALVVVSSLLMILLPKTPAMAVPNMVIILVLSFGMFSAKGVYMVPASKVPMPEKYRGGAMSIDSFVAYCPNLFAMTWAGHILDTSAPVAAFNQIWIIVTVVGLVGILLAGLTLRTEKQSKAQQTSQK